MLYLYESNYSGTIGSGGAEGGVLAGHYVDFSSATVNGSAVDVFGVWVDFRNMTNTSSDQIAGVKIMVDSYNENATF